MDLLQLHGQHGQLGTEHMGADGLQQGKPKASGFVKDTAKFGLVGFLFFFPTNNKLSRTKTLCILVGCVCRGTLRDGVSSLPEEGVQHCPNHCSEALEVSDTQSQMLQGRSCCIRNSFMVSAVAFGGNNLITLFFRSICGRGTSCNRADSSAG